MSVVLFIVLVFEAFSPRTLLRPDRTVDYLPTASIHHGASPGAGR